MENGSVQPLHHTACKMNSWMHHIWAHMPGLVWCKEWRRPLCSVIAICTFPCLSNSGVQDSCTARSLKICMISVVFPRLATILYC